MMLEAVDLALRASLVLAATWSIAHAAGCIGSSAAKRHTIWTAGFAALALLPLCVLLLPTLALPVLPANPVAAAPQIASGSIIASPAPSDLWMGLLFYGLVAALLVGRLFVGMLMLEGLWRRSRSLESTNVQLHLAVQSLGIDRPVAVRASAEVHVPMTWGFLRPRILLPADARDWHARKWRAVLLHELAHVSRGDSWVRFAVEAVCAVYWLHPAVWLSARRLRLAQEQACDDIVLRHGAAAIPYARELVDSAAAFNRSHVALAVAGTTDLECRVKSILGGGSRSPTSGRFALSTVLLVLVAAPFVAVVTPGRAQSTESQAPSVPATNLAPFKTPAARLIARREAVQLKPYRPSRETLAREPHAKAPRLSLPTDADDYADQLARYGEEVKAYNSGLIRYRAELDRYSIENEKFARDVGEYRHRMAEIGPDPPPGVSLPTYPTAPTTPVAPTVPTVPVRPL